MLSEPRVFLCRHMYTCDDRCYDYGNGHICKHIHCVHSLQQYYDTSEAAPDHYSMPLFYPLGDNKLCDDGNSKDKHGINIQFTINKLLLYIRSHRTSTNHTKTFG